MSSFPEYDSDNRFMRCAMEHKIKSYSTSIDRFDILRHNSSNPIPIPNSHSNPIPIPNKNIVLEKVSIKNNRELRSNSCSSIFSNSSTSSQKYPNSKLRSSKQDVRSSQDSFDEQFPCLSINTISPNSIRSPVSKISTPSPSISSKKILDPNGTVKLSVQGGKVIKEELYTMVPDEPTPLVITPSKWSDLFHTTNN